MYRNLQGWYLALHWFTDKGNVPVHPDSRESPEEEGAEFISDTKPPRVTTFVVERGEDKGSNAEVVG